MNRQGKFSRRSLLGLSVLLALSAPAPLLAAPAWTVTADQAAVVEAQKIAWADQRAASAGYVALLIGLDVDAPLSRIANDRAGLAAEATTRLNALLQELSGHVLLSTVRPNTLGQVRLHVDQTGVDIVNRSTQVGSWELDSHQALRTGISDHYGEVKALEEQIAKDGQAKVEVSLNLEELGPDDGEADYADAQGAKAQEFRAKAMVFLDAMPESGVLNLAEARSLLEQGQLHGPVLPLTVNIEGLWLLREHPDVRALHGVSLPLLPFGFDLAVLKEARDEGTARVYLNFRPPRHYSALVPKLPAKAAEAQTAWLNARNRRLVAEIAPQARAISWFDGLSSVALDLDYDSLQSLFRNPDPRLESITPVYRFSPSLNYSTPAMNLPATWAAGYRGAGQYIAVLDTGVEKSHPFLVNQVAYEACFGAALNNPKYVSMCPNADANGDSIGVPGSGEPCIVTSECNHGTEVAGIAAGHPGANPQIPGLAGAANGAQLASIQIYSRTPGVAPHTVALGDDMITALQHVLSFHAPNITVNLSVAVEGQVWGGPCSGPEGDPGQPTITDVVAWLKAQQIPVVVSTGNDGNTGGVSSPACVDGTVKATATDDALNLAGFSNAWMLLGPQWGPLFAAPGTGEPYHEGIITSNINGGWSSPHGTSFAAPHVAGAFAIAKAAAPGLSVDQLSDWFNRLGSRQVNFSSTLNYVIHFIYSPV